MGNYYEAPTPESLKRGYFWMTHRKMYKNILLGIFAGVICVILGVAAFNFYKYYNSTSFDSQAKSLAVQKYWLEYHRINGPKDIIEYKANTKAISIGANLYDLVASMENPNEEWAISELKYHFVVNNVILESSTTFFNPGESRIVLLPGYKSNRPISKVEIKIEDTKWRRYEDDTMIVNWQVEDIKFKATSREIDGNQSFTVPPSVSWKATNSSLYDFWEVSFQVALYNGDSLVGVREWRENYFDALETKEFEVIWLSDLPRVSDVKIYPVLNLLDRDNLREIRADIFSDTREDL